MTTARMKAACAPSAALLVMVAGVAGCAHHAGPPPVVPGMPAPTAADLPPPDAVPGAFSVRQRLVARSARGGGSFEAVLQKKPGRLALLGLTPFGTRAFLLEQVPGDVKFTSYMPREMPFPPTFILLDIHRVMDAWLGPPLQQGERTGAVGGERIHERWQAGQVVERTFVRGDGQPPQPVTIWFSGAVVGGVAAHIEITNARFGYTLTIDALRGP